jgi:hypothetical protein
VTWPTFCHVILLTTHQSPPHDIPKYSRLARR